MFTSGEASRGDTEADSIRPGRRKSFLRPRKQYASNHDEKGTGGDSKDAVVDMKVEEEDGYNEKAKEDAAPSVSFFQMFR